MSEMKQVRVQDVAKRVRGVVTGSQSRVISAVATLEDAGPGDLSWAGTADLLPRAEKSRAGIILIPEGCTLPGDRTYITVADPDAAVAEVLAMLAPPVERVEPGVHPTAIIGEEAVVDGAAIGAHVYVGARAVIGPGTQLHPGVYVGSDTRIGRDCVLWPNVVVRERCTLCDRVVIHPNSTIGGDGFGYLFRDGAHRKIPQIGTVVIEDDVEIGSCTTIDRARSGVTRVGGGTKIDNQVQIGHNCDIGEHCMIVAMCGLAGSVTLGHHVVMGAAAGATDHVTIGDGAQIAGRAGVSKDVPAGGAVRGNPAVEYGRFMRREVTIRRLPEWIEKVRQLIKRVERLESKTPDPRTPKR